MPDLRFSDETRPPATVARFIFVGCVLASWAGSAAAAAELRGFVSAGPYDTLIFGPCNGSKASSRVYRLDDATPEAALSAGVLAVQKIRHNPNRPLYIEFQGNSAGPVVTAHRFQRALGTVDSCSAVPGDIASTARIAAAGEDPAWRFNAAAAGAQLEVAGARPVRFPAAPFGTPIVEKNIRIYDAWSSLDSGSIRMEITQQLCSDGRSESAYGARVHLRYGSTSFEGCAARY